MSDNLNNNALDDTSKDDPAEGHVEDDTYIKDDMKHRSKGQQKNRNKQDQRTKTKKLAAETYIIIHFPFFYI